MPNIHVCLVSDQPIPNLTTALQFKPDRVILLATDEMSNQTARLEKVIKNMGMKAEIRTIKAYDINNVIQVSELLIKECASCNISLNITGGTKISTLGAYQAFYTNGKPIFYVNTRDGEILQISPEERKIPISVTIPVKDYLSVYGFTLQKETKNYEQIHKRRSATEALLELALSQPYMIGKLNYTFPENVDKATYPIHLTLPDINKFGNILNTVGKYFPVTVSGNKVMVGNYDAARYLRGLWLEEYVYLTAQHIGANEVKLNVEGTWDIRSKYPPKNEFDVLISKGVRLCMISCKTTNADRKRKEDDKESISKEYIYELDSLSDHALGLFGKRMLISARPIADEYVKRRADILNIKIIDGNNIRTLKENLRQWISK